MFTDIIFCFLSRVIFFTRNLIRKKICSSHRWLSQIIRNNDATHGLLAADNHCRDYFFYSFFFVLIPRERRGNGHCPRKKTPPRAFNSFRRFRIVPRLIFHPARESIRGSLLVSSNRTAANSCRSRVPKSLYTSTTKMSRMLRWPYL